MKFRKILVVFAAATLAAACAATDTQRSTGEYVDDTVLTARVKTALAEDPVAEAHEIDVEVNRGIVQLNGFVDSADNRNAAGRVAKGVDGVKEVRNNLAVRGTETAGKIVDDSVITAQVKTALFDDPVTKGHEINVETQNGIVQLSGFVDSNEQRLKATTVARDIDGVKEVRNQIDVKPKS